MVLKVIGGFVVIAAGFVAANAIAYRWLNKASAIEEL